MPSASAAGLTSGFFWCLHFADMHLHLLTKNVALLRSVMPDVQTNSPSLQAKLHCHFPLPFRKKRCINYQRQ